MVKSRYQNRDAVKVHARQLLRFGCTLATVPVERWCGRPLQSPSGGSVAAMRAAKREEGRNRQPHATRGVLVVREPPVSMSAQSTPE